MKGHDETARLHAKRRFLETRCRTLQSVRRFFDRRGYLEVETPIRLPTPALELHIDAETSGPCFLRTSPELALKRLMAAGYERLYEIGSCFRQGELGPLHNPEYTMLEWYRGGTNYEGTLAETEELVDQAVRAVLGGPAIPGKGTPIDVRPPWPRMRVAEVFQRHAGWDPTRNYDGDRFDVDLVTKVEPALPRDRPVILMDYPAEAAALSTIRRTQEPPVAERWELYLGGIEIANAYTELTDPQEQRQRFEACAEQRRQQGREAYELDEAFLAALEHGLPPCSGVALGIDRLVMMMCGASSIHEVRAFSAWID